MEKSCLNKKILINAITLDGSNIAPLLLKIKKWQENGAEISFFGNKIFEEQMKSYNLVKNYKFIELKKTKQIQGRFHLIFEGLSRNLRSIFYIKHFKGEFTTVYSLSSVLDQILLPYFLKKFDKKIKWITVFDNTVPLSGASSVGVRLLAWIFFKVSLMLLKKSDQIFTVSEELRDFLLKSNFSSSKISLSDNGIENEFIKNASYKKILETDMLFIGRINEAKGIYDCLEVLSRIRERIPNIQLSIMGDGDKATLNKFKNKIAQMKLNDNVKFLGFKKGSEKFDIIKSSKIFLFLSHRESFGISLLEAVCSGIPCIAYDLPVFRNLYKRGEVYFFNRNDFKGISEKVLDMIEKNDFENKNGPLLLDKFSWDKRADMEYNFIQ